MKPLYKFLNDYLTIKRSLGFKYKHEECLLKNFVNFMKHKKKKFITTDLALTWAKGPKSKKTITIVGRFYLIKKFAEYICLEDARHEIPLSYQLPRVKPHRKCFHIYTEEEIIRILNSTAMFHSTVKRQNYYTLFGLLASTGMRISEALTLNKNDFDSQKRTIIIYQSKTKQSRRILLHPTVNEKLIVYLKKRNSLFPQKDKIAFFISTKGTRLHRNNVSPAFDKMLKTVGLYNKYPKPRIHDLRYAFILTTIKRWYEEGKNVESKLQNLSTYVGHVSPSSTYWYLTAGHELMYCASKLLEKRMGEIL